jgi:cyclic pyranopterin phosphate synthase
MPGIQDKYGRRFKTLRVSLLSSCNLGCVYCVSGDDARTASGIPAAATDKALNGSSLHLSVPDLLQVIERLHGQLELDTIRLTGGEPLLYKGLIEVIEGIRSIGIPEIKLTTNGFLLQRLAAPMRAAGLGSVNVSLDAMNEDVFFRMSKRRQVQRIIDGIDAALAAGLKVKINTVVMKGMNDTELIPLTEFAFSRGIPIRFLELMAMGYLHDRSAEYLFTQEEMLAVLSAHYRFVLMPRADSATANYWRTEQGHIFGIIANESEPFCQDCNRLRLDSRGNIFGCLSSNHPIALDRADDEAVWSEKLQEALAQKQAFRFTGSDLSMLEIGG